jgi:hypothetical protein
MKFFDNGSIHIFRKGDIRGWLDRKLCWLFHAQNYWRAVFVKDVDVPVIECLKCDHRWYNKEYDQFI